MRVLLATDSQDLGHALSLYLSERRIQVVDVVDDADCLLARAVTACPDVVLLDWGLGEAASSRLVNDLMRRDDPAPVIVLSTSRDRPKARATGATACATLGDPPDALVAAIRELAPERRVDAAGGEA
jgi:DNA-binding response OmpR family regulator